MKRVLDTYGWIADRFAPTKEESGGTYVTAACPFKAHRTAQMRFWLGDGGQLMFGCYGGCNKLEILRAVGASWKDCWPEGTDLKAVKQEIVARYRYRDESGVLLYETVRLEPGRNGRDKDFRQRRPKVGGGWDWSLGDVRRVLYQLPALLDPANVDRMILVVGGEKDCDSLKAIDVLATTNVCGERSEWLPEYSQVLAGRNVVVVEDRDSAGCRHANEVVGSLLAHDVGSVRRTSLPAKDSTAFLNMLRARGISRPVQLRQELWASLQLAKKWEPART